MTLEEDTRGRRRWTSVRLAAPSAAAAVLVAWVAAEGLVALLADLGLPRPSVPALVAVWPALLLLPAPLGRAVLASGARRHPVATSAAALLLTWAGCAVLLVPECYAVAAAGVEHLVLQVRPRRWLLLLLLGGLAAGTAAVVVGTSTGLVASLLPAPVGDLLAVALLLLVLGQVASSAALSRSAETTARHLAEQEDERLRELRHAAMHDPLTGALNRRGLFEELQGALVAPSPGTALVFLDLDGFKSVNDTHGHDVGDELLVAVAARLRTALRQPPRQADLLARLGGDEFVAVLVEVPTAEVAERVVDRLRTAVTAPVRTSAGEVVVGVSTGTAHVAGPVDGPAACAAEQLLRRADERMYAQKGSRRRLAAVPAR